MEPRFVSEPSIFTTKRTVSAYSGQGLACYFQNFTKISTIKLKMCEYFYPNLIRRAAIGVKKAWPDSVLTNGSRSTTLIAPENQIELDDFIGFNGNVPLSLRTTIKTNKFSLVHPE